MALSGGDKRGLVKKGANYSFLRGFKGNVCINLHHCHERSRENSNISSQNAGSD